MPLLRSSGTPGPRKRSCSLTHDRLLEPIRDRLATSRHSIALVAVGSDLPRPPAPARAPGAAHRAASGHQCCDGPWCPGHGPERRSGQGASSTSYGQQDVRQAPRPDRSPCSVPSPTRLPVYPAEVSTARALARGKLEEWGLDDATFVAELVVSELVTDAIRYGGPPVSLRLLRDVDRTLICEVSDGGHTSPHLRRAGDEDEGGRGLFLVAQLTDMWGTRYGRQGKTIWAEIGRGQEMPLELFPSLDSVGDL